MVYNLFRLLCAMSMRGRLAPSLFLPQFIVGLT
jgi:hypothetical protein